MANVRSIAKSSGNLQDVHIRNFIRAAVPVAIADGGGLTFTLSKAGTAAWILRYRFGGRPRELTIGRYPDLSLMDARKIARARRVDIDNGIDPAAEKRRIRSGMVSEWTVRELDRDYRERILVGLAPGTQNGYNRNLKRLTAKLGSALVGSVKPADIVRVIENGNLTWAEANMLRSSAVALFNHAKGKKMIDVSPAAGISLKAIMGEKPPTKKRLMLSADELNIVMNAAMSPSNLLSVWILLGTAVRVSELYSAKWEDLDFEARIWHLPKSKMGAAMDIPLASPVVEWFRELEGLSFGSKYVLPARSEARLNRNGGDTHVNVNTVGNAIEYWFEQHTPAVRRFTPHDCRSTAKSQMRALGVSKEISEMCLNHKLPGVEGIYDVHTYFDERKAALDLWASFMVECQAGQKGKLGPGRKAV